MENGRKELWVIEASTNAESNKWSRVFGEDGQLLAFDTEERANFWLKKHRPSGRCRTVKYEEAA